MDDTIINENFLFYMMSEVFSILSVCFPSEKNVKVKMKKSSHVIDLSFRTCSRLRFPFF